MLTSTAPLLPLCSSMMVSVRWPTSPPVARSFSSCAVRPCRLSEPTISQLVPSPEPALDAGSAATWLSWVSTQTRKPTTATSSTTSSTNRRRPRPPRRRGLRSTGRRGGRRTVRTGGRSGVRSGGRRPRASARWAAAAGTDGERSVGAGRAAGCAAAGSGPRARAVGRRRSRAGGGPDRHGAVAPRGPGPTRHRSPHSPAALGRRCAEALRHWLARTLAHPAHRPGSWTTSARTIRIGTSRARACRHPCAARGTSRHTRVGAAAPSVTGAAADPGCDTGV